MTEVGDTAIAFELPDVFGKSHTQAEFLGGWLLLVFHRHLG